MKKTTLAFLALAIAACSSHDATQRHGFAEGPQPVSLSLASGDNNDVALNPGNSSPTTLIRLAPASGGSTVTGLALAAADDGDFYMLRNESTTDSVTLANNRTSATGNRFLLPSAGDVVLPPKSAVWIERDKTAGKWEMGPGFINAPTFNGTVTMAGSVSTTNASFSVGQETKTSGALSLSNKSLLSVTNTVAFTLADGTVTGQRKTMEVTAVSGTPLGTLTIATPAGSEPATHVFSAVGQALTLEWNGTGWHVIGKVRAGHRAIVVGTTTTTGMDMAYTYDLSVTGTVSSTDASHKLQDGLVPGEVIHLDVTTAASNAAGTLGFTGMSAAGVAVTSAAGIGNSATDKSFVLAMVWSGAEWQIVYLGTNTGVTISMLDAFDGMRALAANDNAAADLAA